MLRDPLFKVLGPKDMFPISEARQFNLGVQIDTEEYYSACMIDYPRRMCSWLCNLFKFSEISDNISETVQGRYI